MLPVVAQQLSFFKDVIPERRSRRLRQGELAKAELVGGQGRLADGPSHIFPSRQLQA